MKAAKELLDPISNHDNWTTLLQVAAREVFELMLSCELQPFHPESPASLEVTSMVGLAGELCGVLSVCCTRESAVIMASKMLGVEPENIGNELADALGEVANMVAGNFKNKVSGLGDGCMLSVPTVVIGADYNVHSLANSHTLELNFLFDNKHILISLTIHS
jgi:chemotaxis protein CheX